MEVKFEVGTYEICRNGPGSLLIHNLGPGTVSFPDAGIAGRLAPNDCARIMNFKFIQVSAKPVTLRLEL